ANGSWSVAFAIERADGSKASLGSFRDGTPTALVTVKSGEPLVVVADVHAPADAAKGGAQQKVYYALAFRPPAASGPGSASGGTLDEARAITLLVDVPGTLEGSSLGGGAPGGGTPSRPPVGESPANWP